MMRSEANRILRGFNLDIDVERPLEDYSVATRQMVAIARAVTQDARLVIMDEPTSSLDDREVELLFQTLRKLKSDGVAVVFISHRLDELYAICDRVTIMRDGRTVRVGRMDAISKIELVRAMLGKELTAFTSHSHARKKEGTGKPFVEVEHVASGIRVRDVSLRIAAGEIGGLAGLLGSGRTETARLIYGADRKDGGAIRIGARGTNYRHPADAIRDGIGFVSEDRKVEGIIPEMSVRENMTLAVLPQLVRRGIVDQGAQQVIVERYIRAMGIKCTSPDQKIRELSGGNQQKVLLARWLCMSPRLLIVDEPTRGIDVGAKREIYTLIDELAHDGLGVIVVSSELPEVLAISDRLIVMCEGRKTAEFARGEANEQNVMSAALPKALV
jgi:ribose transport system ATP-binding protein